MKFFDKRGQIIELLLYQDLVDDRNRGLLKKKPKPSYTKTYMIENILGCYIGQNYLDFINELIIKKALVLDYRRSKKSNRNYYFIIEKKLCEIYMKMDMCRILEQNHDNYYLS